MRIWQKISLGVLVLGVLGVGLTRLRLEADILATLPPQLPEVQGLKLLRDAFEGGDELVLCVETPVSSSTQHAITSLAKHLEEANTAKELVKRVRWGSTFESAQSASTLLAWALQNAPPEKLAALRDRLLAVNLPAHLEGVLDKLASSPDPAEVQRWSYDPLGLLEGFDLQSLGSMEDSGFDTASADGTFRLMFIAPKDKLTSYKQATLWLEDLRAEIEVWRKANPEIDAVTFRYTGEPAFLAETGQGIEKDMKSTIGITEVLITILFWVMFRRLKPLLWIQLLLALILLLTLALASLVLGSVSVMSFGFASIVLGIVVDYAVLILQESMDHPQLKSGPLRRQTMPGIIAGAGTTSVVFLSLLFSGLPGLADLGMLVAIGVIVGLVVMLVCMPVLVVNKKPSVAEHPASALVPVKSGVAVFSTLALLVGTSVVLVARGLPKYQSGSDALRPSQSQAMTTWDILQQRLGKEHQSSVPLLVTGKDETLRPHADTVKTALDEARLKGTILNYSLPAALLENTPAQRVNRSVVEWLLEEQARLKEGVLAAGFTEESLALTNGVFAVWQRALEKPWPMPASASEAGEVLGRFMGASQALADTMNHENHVLLGSVTLPGEPGTPDAGALLELQEQLKPLPFARLTGWESLGSALSKLVHTEITRLTLPLVAVLAIMLTLTFRNGRDIILSVFLLSLGIAALAATMAALGQTWNLASLAALPLLLGTGIDYGIHIMLALERENNDIAKVRATTGRAVFFSGMTTIIGFSSLMFAGNKGVASLGVACCIGTSWILLLVLWLLPHWRVWLTPGRKQ